MIAQGYAAEVSKYCCGDGGIGWLDEQVHARGGIGDALCDAVGRGYGKCEEGLAISRDDGARIYEQCAVQVYALRCADKVGYAVGQGYFQAVTVGRRP